jgi:hypothetical protein
MGIVGTGAWKQGLALQSDHHSAIVYLLSTCSLLVGIARSVVKGSYQH